MKCVIWVIHANFSRATWRKHCSKSEYLYYMYIRDHTCIYIYLHIYGTTMKRKTYKCEDPYHCSAMRSSPETCGTFQVKWRTTTMAAWQLEADTSHQVHLFFDGTILIALFHIFLRRKTQKKTPPPSETRNCTIWFIGLPIDFPIPLLNKVYWLKVLLNQPSVISPRKVKTCQSLTPPLSTHSWIMAAMGFAQLRLDVAMACTCSTLGKSHLQKHARYQSTKRTGLSYNPYWELYITRAWTKGQKLSGLVKKLVESKSIWVNHYNSSCPKSLVDSTCWCNQY